MKIDKDICIKCKSCIPYCPVEAIKSDDIVYIDEMLCVECGVCLKSGVCPVDAIYLGELEWPRNLMQQFSDPLCTHPSTGIKGRGTVEMKTNDVTGRYKVGEVGFALELGRPGVSASFGDVEKISSAISHLVYFEPVSPVTQLIDTETGKLLDEKIRDSRVLSAIIEAKTEEENGVEVIRILERVSGEIDTVFSVCVINRCVNGVSPFKAIMEAEGYVPRINGKTNVGLGRPLA